MSIIYTLSPYLLCLSLFCWIFYSDSFSQKLRIVALFVVTLLIAIPLPGLDAPIAKTLQAYTMHLSITGLLMLVALQARFWTRQAILPNKTTSTFCFVGLMLGVILYPSALGVSLIDTYIWGYDATWSVVMMTSLSLLLFVIKERLLSVASLIILLAYQLRLFSSNNVWDYLLDPIIFLFCLGYVLFWLCQKMPAHAMPSIQRSK